MSVLRARHPVIISAPYGLLRLLILGPGGSKVRPYGMPRVHTFGTFKNLVLQGTTFKPRVVPPRSFRMCMLHVSRSVPLHSSSLKLPSLKECHASLMQAVARSSRSLAARSRLVRQPSSEPLIRMAVATAVMPCELYAPQPHASRPHS
eukprot:scaffold81516_cov72-Phaeocystis_antarctica.AAC.1